MNTYDFVHLALLALGGEVHGRTKLQKQVFFIGVMTGSEENLGYRAHYYGPYSDAVAEAVGQLRELGFISTNSTTWGVDAKGFEISRTDYCLTQEGREIADRKAQQDPALWTKVREAAAALKGVGDLDYVRLSIAAKTYYILRQKQGPIAQPDLVKLAAEFSWKVTDEQVSEAASYLQSLNLVTVQPAS